jgi:hypothetical protein
VLVFVFVLVLVLENAVLMYLQFELLRGKNHAILTGTRSVISSSTSTRKSSHKNYASLFGGADHAEKRRL